MNGKSKCKILKEIRRRIAEQNDIEYVVRECTHQGNCKGTCPRCEAEVRYLEAELEKRRSLGKKVTLAVAAAGLSLGLIGCTLPGGNPGTDPEPVKPIKTEKTEKTEKTKTDPKPRGEKDLDIKNDTAGFNDLTDVDGYIDGGELEGEPIELEGDVPYIMGPDDGAYELEGDVAEPEPDVLEGAPEAVEE